MTIEAALGVEIGHHLSYPKHGQNDSEIDTGSNTCNAYYPKIVKGNHGEVEFDIPRNRNASFEPLIVEKSQIRLGAFKVVFLAIEAASKKWTMPIRNSPQAMNWFIILHEDRLKNYV